MAVRSLERDLGVARQRPDQWVAATREGDPLRLDEVGRLGLHPGALALGAPDTARAMARAWNAENRDLPVRAMRWADALQLEIARARSHLVILGGELKA